MKGTWYIHLEHRTNERKPTERRTALQRAVTDQFLEDNLMGEDLGKVVRKMEFEIRAAEHHS